VTAPDDSTSRSDSAQDAGFVLRSGASSLLLTPDAIELRVGDTVVRLAADGLVLAVGPQTRLELAGDVATLAVDANSVRVGPHAVSINDDALEVT
jgi:hypothetical protein